MTAPSPVRELRLAVTVEDYEQALAFYRDALGLPVLESWDDDTRRGVILDAGRATLELLTVDQTKLIDDVEVGRRASRRRSGSRSRSRTRRRPHRRSPPQARRCSAAWRRRRGAI